VHAKQMGRTDGDRRVRVLPIISVRIYREWISAAICGDDNMELVSAVHRQCGDALNASGADVAVLDGLCLACSDRICLVRSASLRVIIIGVAEHEVNACIERGADGIVTVDGCLDDLMAAIYGVVRDEVAGGGGSTASKLIILPVARGGRSLTEREWQVVELLDMGMANKDIARELNIELATVKNHVHSVLAKLEVTRRLEVPRRVRDLGGGIAGNENGRRPSRY
jgi:two-component system, NarL family, nitrate/nitrite response regulator NarL